MKRNGSWLWLLIVLAILSAGLPMLTAQDPQAASSPQTGASTDSQPSPIVPATRAASSPASQPTTAAELRDKGLQTAIAGHFEDALANLQAAGRLAAEDPVTAKATELVAAYIKRQQAAQTQRQAELDMAIQRVHWAFLAQAYQPKMAADEVGKKLRKAMSDLAAAYHRVGTSESLDKATDEQAVEMKATSLKALSEVADALQRARKFLADRDGEYPQTVRSICDQLAARLDEARKTWESMNLVGAKARHAGARTLAGQEDSLNDRLADLDVLTAQKPWRNGMLQATLAKEISLDKESLPAQPWYRKVVSELESIGRAAIEKSDWHEALTAHAGLQALDEYNESYKETVKAVRRHVRVLTMYGGAGGRLMARRGEDETEIMVAPEGATLQLTGEPASAPASQPAGEEAESQPAEEQWQDLVQGVDVDLVRTAIEKLHANYVKAPDYRKLARGGLLSVQVLAETPQVAKTFPGLGDAAKRRAFLDQIESLLKSVDSEDRFEETDLQLILNSVVRTSEKTVQIPTAVVVMEFTDGFLDELDKFTAMVWPHDEDDFNKAMTGRFYGVGIQIAKEPGQPLKVVTPLMDTPAYREGIKTGDLIVAVDGRNTENVPLEKLVRMIMGPKGTKVVLRVKRPGMLEPKDFNIVRDEIQIRTVKGWLQKTNGDWDYLVDPAGGIGYLRATQFTETTHADLAKALDEMQQAGVKSLILDLRFNPGGLLTEAARMADEFLKGGTIVSTSGRQVKPSAISAHSTGRFLAGNDPQDRRDMVVLVNEASASAAEIVAGALQDWQRALIVGERSYGKGSVQKVIPIEGHNAMLKLTTAYYYLPKGRLLHRENNHKDWGVPPDVAVPLTPKQIRKWQTIRNETDLIQDVDPQELTQTLQEQYDADLQLQAAVLVLKLELLREQLATQGVASR